MRRSIIGLTVAAIATVAAGSACVIILGRFAPGVSLLETFLGSSPVPKVIMIFIGLTIIGVTVTGLIGLLVTRRAGSGPGAAEILLGIETAVCTVFGVSAALYSELNTQLAIKAVGAVSFAATAPSRVEALLALATGLAGATLAMAFLVGLENRRMVPRPRPATQPLDM